MTRRARSSWFPCSVLAFFAVLFHLASPGDLAAAPYLSSFLYLAAFALLFAVIHSFPRSGSRRARWTLILLLAFAARSVVLLHPAADDVNRYVWEGHLVLHGVNPYKTAPDHASLEPYKGEMELIWNGINHKGHTACYPPLAQLLFALLAMISPTVLFFKIVLTAVDLGSVLLIMRMAELRNIPPPRTLLYALNPLVLVSVVGEAHVDILQVFFLLLALHLMFMKRDTWSFLALACSVMSKYLSVAVFPFLLTGGNWKKSWSFWATVAVLYLPFQGTGGALFSSLMDLGGLYAQNDLFPAIFKALLGSGWPAGALACLALVYGIIFMTVHDPMRSAYLALGSLMLFLPVINAWYLVLVTPFLVFYPSRGWLWLHGTILPALLLQFHTPLMQGSSWHLWVQYGPLLGLLLLDSYRSKEIFPARLFGPVRDMSVVVPVLDEEANLRACLASLLQEPLVKEVIVVDGGSEDAGVSVARGLGARVIETKKGRGNQINGGLEHCSGDVVLILHADCILEPGVPGRVLEALNERLDGVGGSLGMYYLQGSCRTRLLAFLNNMRARWTGISFGDQGQFFRREVLQLAGGFPRMMLMEDVEWAMRLKEQGPLCFIADGVAVSGRRWEKVGFRQNTARVIALCWGYLLTRRLGLSQGDGRAYHSRYYGLPAGR